MTTPIATTDTGVGTDSAVISLPIPTGHFHIGSFQDGDPLYAIENEIITYAQVDDGTERANVVVVDGKTDSWTEYDRSDLISRDLAVNAYFDLPELTDSGQVRQRAIEELQNARRANSPGGTVVWMPWYDIMDHIYWVDADGSRFVTRIEGIDVDFNQSLTPFQRATIDTGLLVYCPPDDTSATYLARDTFDRNTSNGLGSALTGGDWTIYQG